MKSKKNSLNQTDWEAWGHNFIKFVAPTLAIYFAQLQMGVNWKLALPIAALALYQSLADLFKKWSVGK